MGTWIFYMNTVFKEAWNGPLLFGLSCLVFALGVHGAVMPPPWANPKLNPCATQPRGWQLLYWPEDGQCYKIFQKGYPCPEDMELSPSATRRGNVAPLAECRCPPGTALYEDNKKCYELFSRGPCQYRSYFSPNSTETTSKKRTGFCQRIDNCANENEVFWPTNGQCYTKLSRGPCPKGELITRGLDAFGVCQCQPRSELLDYYWTPGSACFEHYTKGPCREHGQLFLPNRSCGCHYNLPHYHNYTGKCYEIGTIGPCNQGQLYQIEYSNGRALCKCKSGHILWETDGNCYRPYTQGPCKHGHFLVNSTTCVPIPCSSGYLYFPSQNACYRIGTRGPCSQAEVVIFDFRTRPSVDGISYNGLCSCDLENLNGGVGGGGAAANMSSVCSKVRAHLRCDGDGAVVIDRKCYSLYTQGPCAKGQWLVPKRNPKLDLFREEPNLSQDNARCECKPGYTERVVKIDDDRRTEIECVSPTVTLANYLNRKYLTLYSQK